MFFRHKSNVILVLGQISISYSNKIFLRVTRVPSETSPKNKHKAILDFRFSSRDLKQVLDQNLAGMLATLRGRTSD